MEAVSLAFEFLKDETGSIVTDNDDNIEYHEPEQENEKQPVFRFLPPPINAITKFVYLLFIIFFLRFIYFIEKSLLVLTIMS